jgi:hypothetical protein
MTGKKLTHSPTEADLEAEIQGALRKAFPWIPGKSLQHQVTFSVTFGHAKIAIDAVQQLRAEGRADVLISWDQTPLCVLELKRSGAALTAEDEAQGLSYANLLRPRFPLVVVTNGEETRFLESHTSNAWQPSSPSEQELKNLMTAASNAASADLKSAIGTLMGSNPAVWLQGVRHASQGQLNDLTGAWNEPLRPFVRGFLFPRKASLAVLKALESGGRLLLIEGAPLVGKSSVLREIVLRTLKMDGLAVLFVPADEGSGIFQKIANILSETLAWPVTSDEARTWLSRLSRAQGPALVLAVDGVGPEHERLRRELEDLSSSAFGPQLRLVVTADDAVAKQLTLHPKGRQASPIGQRLDGAIGLDVLDDDEFDRAAEALWDRRMGIMHGGRSAQELRVPWILRALGGRYAPEPGEKPDHAAVLPPQLSLDLIIHTRERFTDDELRRQFRETAKAVLRDAEDVKRPIALMLESMATFVVRRQTLREFLELSEIESLITRGFLKPVLHTSGEAVLFVRLPELLASEASIVLASDLIERARKDAAETAKWLVTLTSRLPLGDIIAAYSFADAVHGKVGVPLNVLAALVSMPPKKTPIAPGTKAAIHVPGIGIMDMTFQADGSVVGELGGRSHTFPADPDEGVGHLMGDFHSWLILSHLAGQRMVIDRDGEAIRIDLPLLAKVGTCPHVLRRPDTLLEGRGILTHNIAGYGEIACHEAGIVEPITYSLFKMLSTEGPEQESWIQEAIDEGSLALLTRVDIALRETEKLADEVLRPWAKRMRTERIAPALQAALARQVK